MEHSALKEIYNEPACSHNQDKTTQGCPRPTPGKAAGGCTFDGAFISLQPITDAAHIIHGPSGCSSNNWNNRGSLTSGPDLYRQAFTTNLNNNDVVFGGEKKLYKAIKEIDQKYNPPAVFVYQTCVTAMIGDDMEALCEAVSKKIGKPVIPVEAPGFLGNKNFGNRIAGDALLKYVIGTQEPETEHPYNINLIAEFNIAGELWNVLPLLDQLGIRLICSLSGDAQYHQVAMMHKADVNVMLCSRALLNVARGMEEKYGIPYFEGSFYGNSNTRETILKITDILGSEELKQRAITLLDKEDEKSSQELESLKENLTGKRVLLYTGGVKSWSFVSALQDLGMQVIATGTRKSTEEDKQRIIQLMGEDDTMIENGAPTKLLELCEKYRVDLLMAGGRNQYTALKARLPFVDVNQERHISFTGYNGMLNLARMMNRALHSPAVRLARKEDPFEK